MLSALSVIPLTHGRGKKRRFFYNVLSPSGKERGKEKGGGEVSSPLIRRGREKRNHQTPGKRNETTWGEKGGGT